MTKPTLSFDAGILLCGQIRRELDKAKFSGNIEDYIESNGWITRTFTVKAEQHQLESVKRWLDRLIEAQND